ncbi:MAG: cysteine synthase A, partial [Syntrophomonadaceae bacterium]|nr:cysteine synthase A [Syntrophomonadaceae bacterium]
MRVATSVLQLIGRTPILRLDRMTGPGSGRVFLKLEAWNPGGSIKDRPALFMIEQAERDGSLRPGATIIEATSGNTGIGLAMVAAVKGYPIVIVMPENMSEERKKILRAYGAQLVLTPAAEGMAGAVRRAEELAAADDKFFMPRQFENPANAASHQLTTAQEILEQMGTEIDVLVAGVGSGGTITGLAEALKPRIPGLRVVAVEPSASPVLSGGQPGRHDIQGIGPGFVPPALRMDLVDEVFPVGDQEALDTAREIARREGLLVGISTGAAVFCALTLAAGMGRGARVLAIAPDGGDKYLTT